MPHRTDEHIAAGARCAARNIARRGTTLIEVLAGLIILGTLLASVATARGRFLRQWGQADRRLQVIQATDNLINSWMSIQPSSAGTCAVPASGSGSLPGAPGCSWRTRLVRSSAARPLAAVVVRLEVFDRPGYAAEPLLAIELLAHDPGRRPRTTAPVASPRGPQSPISPGAAR